MTSTDSSSQASLFVSENEYLSKYEELSEIEAGEPGQIEHFEDTSSEVHVTESNNNAYSWADDPALILSLNEQQYMKRK
jgi:hypothetical protein